MKRIDQQDGPLYSGWDGKEPPYSMSPILADLIIAELVERGGIFEASKRYGQGAISCLIEVVLPRQFVSGLMQHASGAASRLEKEGWIKRLYTNPHTGKKQHGAYSVELLRTPTAQELEVFQASRDLAVRDLTGKKPPENISELGNVMLQMSQKYHDLQLRVSRQSAYADRARAEKSDLEEENQRLLAEIETLKAQLAAHLDVQSDGEIEGWTREDAGLQMQYHVRDLGEEPTREDVEASAKQWESPSLKVYEGFFGSLAAAIAYAADLPSE